MHILYHILHLHPKFLEEACKVLPSLFCWWGSWGLENLRDLPKATQLVRRWLALEPVLILAYAITSLVGNPQRGQIVPWACSPLSHLQAFAHGFQATCNALSFYLSQLWKCFPCFSYSSAISLLKSHLPPCCSWAPDMQDSLHRCKTNASMPTSSRFLLQRF